MTWHEIDYRGNVKQGETVTARTWIPQGPRGARFDRHMEFTGPDGKVRVSAKSTWAIVDKATGRILRVPADVAAICISAFVICALAAYIPARIASRLDPVKALRYE